MKVFKIIKGVLELLVLITMPVSIILWIWGVNPYLMSRLLATSFIMFFLMLSATFVKSSTDEYKKKIDKTNNPKPKRSKFQERLTALQKEMKK